jgi:ketosteroid isomerase-like protein
MVFFLAASMWIGARFLSDDGPAYTTDRAAAPNIPIASRDMAPPQPPLAPPQLNLPPAQPSVAGSGEADLQAADHRREPAPAAMPPSGASQPATTQATANPAASVAPPSAAHLPVSLRTMVVGQPAQSEPSATPSAPRDVAGTVFSPPGQPVETASEAEAQILAAGRTWLDAYQRGDRSAMAALAASDVTVLDERTPDERFVGSPDVRRALDQVQIHVAGNAGTLTAAMTEEAGIAGQQQHASRLSQTWLRENGKWQLIQVRIISEAQLKQFAR